MNGMPFDMVLTQPLAETFICEGAATSVQHAHNLAWNALTSMVEEADLSAWSMKVMTHGFDPTPPGGVQFHAEFVRNPEYEAEGES